MLVNICLWERDPMGRVWLSSISWLQEKWALTWASVASYDMPARKERDSWSEGSQSHLQESIGESSYATWTENNLYPNLLLEKENQGPQKIENWITIISECLYIYWGFFFFPLALKKISLQRQGWKGVPEDFSTPEPILGRESYDSHPQGRVGATAIESRHVGGAWGLLWSRRNSVGVVWAWQ